MSRKGKNPVNLPKGVELNVHDGKVTVKGPKGTLTQDIPACISVKVEDGIATVEVDGTVENAKAFHGLYRSLIANMVDGITKGFERKLEMIGVGYRAAVKGHAIDIQVGLSHPTLMDIPEGLQVKVEKNTQIFITGIDKRKVGQFAAEIRSVRPPEPYQGKGIRYAGEYVRKKAGKSASASK